MTDKDRLEEASKLHESGKKEILPSRLREIRRTLYEIVTGLSLSRKRQRSCANVVGRLVQTRLSEQSFSHLSKEDIAKRLLLNCLFIAESGCSFHLTQLKTYQDWMKELRQPEASRVALSGPLLELVFRAVRIALKKKMYFYHEKTMEYQSCCSSFSITMDAWTDIGCNNSYLALTRHWIPDHEWNLYSAVLDVIPFSQRHTSENIAYVKLVFDYSI